MIFCTICASMSVPVLGMQAEIAVLFHIPTKYNGKIEYFYPKSVPRAVQRNQQYLPFFSQVQLSQHGITYT